METIASDPIHNAIVSFIRYDKYLARVNHYTMKRSRIYMKKSVFLGKGLTILFIFTIMLGVMLSAGRMEVSAEESGTSEATITPSKPKGEGTEASPY